MPNVLLDLFRILSRCAHIISSAPKFLISVLVPQFRILLVAHQAALPLQVSHKAEHRNLRGVSLLACVHGLGTPLLLQSLFSSNYTAFAKFLLFHVISFHKILFCDAFMWYLHFHLLFLQFTDHTLILSKGSFSVYIIAIRLLFKHSPRKWFLHTKRQPLIYGCLKWTYRFQFYSFISIVKTSYFI